ncbi:N-acetylglucosamine-6-phosphate deacetylase [Citreimonas salinaria]|uniref:N-acetylglucosamine 6-phosphate deacetylase n=1 Tax=Citreimonas salinaria TaxID=321339 RepID=A0A1H3MKZ6_9RHOB|nr:amidohydrolase family protein [Citreimonas salinaria]SDY77108.1 N-acetylglucosamine 6-phosphate deacetylase [Citreimonas salinaria]
MTNHIDGSILTPDGWIAGRLDHDAKIVSVQGDAIAAPRPPYILPGFVDCHVHGGGGADMMEGAEAIRTAARLHARHGTTALCATSVTAPTGDIDAFLDDVAAVMADPATDGARVLGAHLEGPFINPDKLGAQPPFARPADAAQLKAWAARAPVLIMTLAPEMDEDGALLDALAAAGIRAQLGHSLCDYALARAALARGVGVTHLFNAMSALAHRNNGLCGAAFAHADYAEIIPDLVHVEPGAILAARHAIPNLYGVTDATGGAGMPDGTYRLGSLDVEKADGAMRLADGTLAGSALTMDQALRNLVGIGLPLDEAARRLSTIPADWLGLTDIGRLAPGARADIVVLDASLALSRVIAGGHDIPNPR